MKFIVPPSRKRSGMGISMQQGLISVIVPVYQVKEYLSRCVRSIERQTYGDLEILLVDDGSTDGTGELCDALSREDERIRVFHKENGGTSSARNLGLAQAKGEYLGFVDGDDFIEPDMYERLMEAALRSGADMVQIGRDELTAKGEVLPPICLPPDEEEKISAQDFLRELLMHRGDCSFCTKLVKRSLFDGKEFPVGALNEDFHVLVMMLFERIRDEEAGGVPWSLTSLPGCGYHVFYRLGSNTRTEKKFSRVYGDNVDNASLVQELVGKTCPQLREVALRFGVYQRLDYLLHVPVEQMDRKNAQYREILAWMRQNLAASLRNPYLTRKNKLYHIIFAFMPKGARMVHRWLKKGSAA